MGCCTKHLSDVSYGVRYMTGIHVLLTSVNTLIFLYSILFRYALPGNDQGSYENPFDSWSLLMNSKNLQLA
jgi:hypothetical protein